MPNQGPSHVIPTFFTSQLHTGICLYFTAAICQTKMDSLFWKFQNSYNENCKLGFYRMYQSNRMFSLCISVLCIQSILLQIMCNHPILNTIKTIKDDHKTDQKNMSGNRYVVFCVYPKIRSYGNQLFKSGYCQC